MSFRAIIIGLALVIIQTAVTPYNDYYLQGTDISGSHFPLGALFALIVLTLGINPILKKITPKAELNPGELMIVWVMLVVTSAIPSKGMMGYLHISRLQSGRESSVQTVGASWDSNGL